jgi:hypothetical protein
VRMHIRICPQGFRRFASVIVLISHFPPISKFGVQEVLCDLLDVEGKESLEP